MKILLVHNFVVILCTVLIFAQGVDNVSSSSNKTKVFLLVLDGFVHNFEELTPNMTNLLRVAANGVRAERMIPSFPSDTWPTMTTLNTGLYTESHGILKNNMEDEAANITFDPKAPDFVDVYGHFYTQEPLWLTNQKQGGKSSVYRWPGHLAFPEKPTYYETVNHTSAHDLYIVASAINETFEHLSADPDLNLMVVYADYPDPVGHKYGVNSSEYRTALHDIDHDIIGNISRRLKKYPDINFIIVADHGMADLTDNKTNIIYMNDYLEKDSFLLKGTQHIIPTGNVTVDEIWKNLTKLNDTGLVQIYRSDIPQYDFPKRLHFHNRQPVSPILILTKPNWMIRKSRLKPFTTIGNHGYDIKYKEMSTIFFARGPSFKKNVTLPAFESVNLVPLLAHLLGIQAKPNNGTLGVFKDGLQDPTTQDDERNELDNKSDSKSIDGLNQFTRFIYY